jgi:integrase
MIPYIYTVLNKREIRYFRRVTRKATKTSRSAAARRARQALQPQHRANLCLLARWYIRFRSRRHPKNMGGDQIRAFLAYLNTERQIAGSTYSQALCALLFLYKEVLHIDLPWIEGLSRRKRPPKRPTVLTPTEVNLVFAQMEGVDLLFCRLLYRTDMRLFEAAQLRIKDIDFQRREIIIQAVKSFEKEAPEAALVKHRQLAGGYAALVVVE